MWWTNWASKPEGGVFHIQHPLYFGISSCLPPPLFRKTDIPFVPICPQIWGYWPQPPPPFSGRTSYMEAHIAQIPDPFVAADRFTGKLRRQAKCNFARDTELTYSVLLIKGSKFAAKSCFDLRLIQCHWVDMKLDAPKINTTFDRKFGNLHYTDDVCILCSVSHFGRVFSFRKRGVEN